MSSAILCVICRVGPERLVFRVSDVHKVVGQVRLCRLPRLPAIVAGITQHRGRIVTVFHIGSLLFGFPSRPLSGPDARVLVIERGQRHLAVGVDAVDEIETLILGGDLPNGPVSSLRVAEYKGMAVFAVDVDALLAHALRASSETGDFPSVAGSV